MLDEAVRGELQRAVCPVGDCQALLTHSELLGHLFSDHVVESPSLAIKFGLRMRRVVSGERTFLPLVHKQLPVGQDQCLGVLNWSGDGSRNLSVPQCNLPPCHRSLINHVPVLVMVCKTTWQALLSNCDNYHDYGHTMGHTNGYVYVFSLVAPATLRPVCGTFGFLNRQLQCGLRVSRRVRNFASRMHINQFLLGADRYYLTLSECQMNRLCGSNGGGSFLEVVILGRQQN